jgi:hypothetical protein
MRRYRVLVRGLGLAAIVGLVGCSTAERQPSPTLTAVRDTLTRPDTMPAADFVQQGALRSDQFPTFGPMPRAANAQMTPQERQRLEAELQAVSAAQRSNPGVTGRYAARQRELQQVARTHGSETRRLIEN